ncbi:MAG: redoxin domain-containing protein [Phycisphaerales bacterium]|nr:redoxin domain-containing protein [Phycisphaerales bacterium]NNM27852.1 redoxin domain-containing protein [Phycisphaerales bacterium]
MAGLVTAAVVTTAFAGPATPDTAKVGQPAPDFTLKDTSGKDVKLSDHKGKIVVMQWINPQCPVCVRCVSSGLVAKMGKELKQLDPDVVHLAVNSTHFMSSTDSAKYLKQHKLDIPALDDHEGKVGHMYGAKTTPHLFVIDKKGVLRYSGAINDDPRGSKGADATNYAVNAVRQIVAGETVAPDSTRPYGCSVKYARGEGKGKGRGNGRRGINRGSGGN